MSTCKHCHSIFDKKAIANHSRWCAKNPKLASYQANPVWKHKIGKKGANQFTYGGSFSDETRKKLSANAAGKKHSNETRALISQKARASKHRRLRKNSVVYNGVLMDSTWEVRLAKRLDSLNIPWIRPEPVVWFDKEGKNHHYFPDFYLPDFDLYLDPKNYGARLAQREKLECLTEQLTNLIILGSIEEIDDFDPRET